MKDYTIADYNRDERSVTIVYSAQDDAETGLGWYWEPILSRMDRIEPKSFATKEEAIKDAERFTRVVIDLK